METVLDFLTKILTVLNHIAVIIPWDVVATSGLLSGLLIPPQKAIKKFFKHNEAIMILLIGVVGPALVAIWTFVIHNYPTNPSVVLVQGFALSFATQPFYFLFWKPYVVKRLVPALVMWCAKQVAEAEKLNEEKTIDLSPAQPISGTPDIKQLDVSLQDFKTK